MDKGERVFSGWVCVCVRVNPEYINLTLANLSQLSGRWHLLTHLLEVPIRLHLLQLASLKRRRGSQMKVGWQMTDTETIQAEM